jgi:hypothetical protein
VAGALVWEDRPDVGESTQTRFGWHGPTPSPAANGVGRNVMPELDVVADGGKEKGGNRLTVSPVLR